MTRIAHAPGTQVRNHSAQGVNNEKKCPQIIGLKSPLFNGSPVQRDSVKVRNGEQANLLVQTVS